MQLNFAKDSAIEDKDKKESQKKAARLLITIAQTGEFNKEEIKRRLLVKYGENIAYCCISREEHKGEAKGIHCHIFINFLNRVNYTYKPNTFEFLFDKPAHIAMVKAGKEDRIRALQYVKKVQDYLEFGKNDIDEGKQIVANVEKYIMKMIEEGIEYEALATHEIEKIRYYALKNSNQIRRIMMEFREAQKWKEKQKLKGIRYIDESLMREVLSELEIKKVERDKGLKRIVEHINKVMVYKGNKPFKDKHLLIWSRGVNKGKTSLIRKLMEYCPMYGFPRDQWFHGYKSNEFWGIFWNEMSLTGVDVEMLKNFFEGSPVKLAIKGSQVEKVDNPQVFMTANVDLENMVSKKYQGNEEREVALEALRARIDEVNVDGHENIFFLSKLIIPIGEK